MTKKVEDMTREEQLAVANLMPSFSAARIIANCSDSVDFMQTNDSLSEMNDALKTGDMSVVESMLLSSAHSLQAIYEKFAVMMVGAEYLEQLEVYGRMALRAQNQQRQVLATLIEAKNPKRALFIRQQNNTLNQQINEAKNPEKKVNPASQLLENTHGQRLDPRKEGTTIEADPQMETVGEVHRTQDS